MSLSAAEPFSPPAKRLKLARPSPPQPQSPALHSSPRPAPTLQLSRQPQQTSHQAMQGRLVPDPVSAFGNAVDRTPVHSADPPPQHAAADFQGSPANQLSMERQTREGTDGHEQAAPAHAVVMQPETQSAPMSLPGSPDSRTQPRNASAQEVAGQPLQGMPAGAEGRAKRVRAPRGLKHMLAGDRSRGPNGGEAVRSQGGLGSQAEDWIQQQGQSLAPRELIAAAAQLQVLPSACLHDDVACCPA